MGSQQSAWLLRALARRLARTPTATFDPAEFRARGGLLIWEAFVSAAGKDRTALQRHIDHARRAVTEFRRRIPEGSVRSDISDALGFNVVGAAALAAGLATDVELLSLPCIVVRIPDLVA